VVPADVWGSALLHFTGSKEHNVRLRQMAIAMGCSLSEYGLVRERDNKRLAGATEEEVYAALGLPWIPPEIREDGGEIEAALAGKLPDLIELEDIKGDCHSHTNESDGVHPLDDLAKAARSKGYEYLVVTDHTQTLTIANGLNPARLDRQLQAIERWNADNDDGHFACSPAAKWTSSTTAASTCPTSASSGSTSWWRACTETSGCRRSG
jgi:DNA polymerase (family X)